VTAFITKPEVPKDAGRWTMLGRGAAVHFSLARPVGEQLEWLERERPSYLVSYPSNVRALARASLELGVTLPGLVDVTVSSEPISDELRALVAEAWGARLVATYSANEVGGIALEGASGECFVQSEFVLVEILRADGTPVGPGKSGAWSSRLSTKPIGRSFVTRSVTTRSSARRPRGRSVCPGSGASWAGSATS
jgi:phenylacetate-CoA ligase